MTLDLIRTTYHYKQTFLNTYLCLNKLDINIDVNLLEYLLKYNYNLDFFKSRMDKLFNGFNINYYNNLFLNKFFNDKQRFNILIDDDTTIYNNTLEILDSLGVAYDDNIHSELSLLDVLNDDNMKEEKIEVFLTQKERILKYQYNGLIQWCEEEFKENIDLWKEPQFKEYLIKNYNDGEYKNTLFKNKAIRKLFKNIEDENGDNLKSFQYQFTKHFLLNLNSNSNIDFIEYIE